MRDFPQKFWFVLASTESESSCIWFMCCCMLLVVFLCDVHILRFLKNLNVIVLTLLESIPAIGAIVITISLVLCKFLCLVTLGLHLQLLLQWLYCFTCNWPQAIIYFNIDIFAVIGRDLYGAVDPARYGNLGKAVFTLFQLITLDDWFKMYSDINPGEVWLLSGLVFLCFYTGQEHILVFLILFIAIETLIFIKLVWTSSLCYNIILYISVCLLQ